MSAVVACGARWAAFASNAVCVAAAGVAIVAVEGLAVDSIFFGLREFLLAKGTNVHVRKRILLGVSIVLASEPPRHFEILDFSSFVGRTVLDCPLVSVF